MAEDFDFIAFKARALDALQVGKPLTGKDGVLAPLLENLLKQPLRVRWTLT